MQLFLQLSKLQGTTSYFDENVGRVGVKSDTVISSILRQNEFSFYVYQAILKRTFRLSERIVNKVTFYVSFSS